MPRLTPQKKTQAIALWASGTAVTKIAEQMNCSGRAIHKMLRKTLGAASPLSNLKETKEKLRRSSYGAVESGLDCTDDNYKRALVGLNLLKHTGDLRPDPAQASILTNGTADWPNDGEAELVASDFALQNELAEIDSAAKVAAAAGGEESHG